jgi:NADPH:quinone reductase
MRAWRVHEHGRPTSVMRLEEIDEPVPGLGEIRVRTTAVTLNFNDADGIEGRYRTVAPTLPFTPGMEVVGVVDATGPGAERWTGRRVAAIPSMAYGGYAEAVLCSSEMAFEMPEDLTGPEAGAVFFPFHLGWLAVQERGRLLAGETLLVHAAAGGIGSAVVQIGKHLGAKVIATAGSNEKLALCLDLGADVAINYREQPFVDAVQEATGGRGVDVAFDSVGGQVTLDTGKCMAFNGRLLLAGFASGIEGEDAGITPRPVVFGNFSLVGVCHAYVSDPLEFRKLVGFNFVAQSEGDKTHAIVLDLIRAGRLRPVVGRHIDFTEIPEGLEAMRRRETVGRIVATLEKPPVTTSRG